MRTFELASSSRFWAIERRGSTVTVHFGKIGGKPVARSTTAEDARAAVRAYRRNIEAKLRDGYVETTTDDLPDLDPTGRALEDALVENPDDLAAHMALADWLSEQSDPRHQARGEFIRLQLQLEDGSVPAAQRRKLRKREKELLDANQRRWMGWRLSDELLDGGSWADEPTPPRPEDELVGYRRGWVDRLRVPLINNALAEAVAHAPSLRLLRELYIENGDYSEDSLAVLAEFTPLGNLRNLRIDDVAHSDHLDTFVSRLPRLEQLHLEALEQDIGDLFSLNTLGHLTYLHVAEAGGYDVKALASNRHLAGLTYLALLPGWTSSADGPHITPDKFRALVRSKHLRNVTRLAVHRTDAGDRGIDDLVRSGMLEQLVELDLSHGCVTDRGAEALAASPAFANLKVLKIEENRLTSSGIAALRRKGLKLEAASQQYPDDDGRYRDGYLYNDDFEYDDDEISDWE